MATIEFIRMQMKSILRVKRDGMELTQEQIKFWIKGIVNGTIPDYQSTAMLMAIYLKGLNVKECSYLTQAMAHSGNITKWDTQPGTHIIDKHSSGGIGDKTSFVITAAMACLGVKVPMISGRGLGFTGGTLDKLHSLPHFTHELDANARESILTKTGAFIAGQTKEIAPADKTLYALRDVTETVANISLITASILSKKLSQGIDGLILDVKCGSGAFMKDEKSAQELAASLVNTAREANMKCKALITKMDFPLGRAVGNLSEMREIFELMEPNSLYFQIASKRTYIRKEKFLHDIIQEPESNLVYITMALLIEMARLAQISPSDAHRNILEAWESGRLKQKFWEILSAQGVIREKAQNLCLSFEKSLEKESKQIKAPKEGFLSHCDGEKLGGIMVDLGAGRKKSTDEIDHHISFFMDAWENKPVQKGETIGRLYAPNVDTETLEKYANNLTECFTILPEPSPEKGVVLHVL